MKLRVLCLQYNPILGELEANKARIRSLLSKIPAIDLLVLPELSITGYNFGDEQAIKPYLDTDSHGVSTNFGKELLSLYQCFTVIGMPQMMDGKIYNSCKLINPRGEIMYNYHKTFLYQTDETWGCSENPDRSFRSVDVILNKNYYLNDTPPSQPYKPTRINFGICMDLNPYKFEAPFNKFEFASSCYHNLSSLIICPMAWLSPYSPSIDDTLTTQQKLTQAETFKHSFDTPAVYNVSSRDNPAFKDLQRFTPDKPDYSTINYHILRFFPFMNHKYNALPKYGPVNVITCNRIGVETDVVYGGSSSIFTFKDIPGNDEIGHLNPSVELKGYLPQATEGILYRELDI